MTTTLAVRPATLSEVLAAVIEVYQRYISPRKGFRCAYRVRHRRSSCSEFARRAVLRQGILRFIPLLRRRFHKCSAAAATAAPAAAPAVVLDYEPATKPEAKKDKSWRESCDLSPGDCIPDGGCVEAPVDADCGGCDAGCDLF